MTQQPEPIDGASPPTRRGTDEPAFPQLSKTGFEAKSTPYTFQPQGSTVARPIPGNTTRAVYRADTDGFLGEVKGDYVIVQNADLRAAIEGACLNVMPPEFLRKVTLRESLVGDGREIEFTFGLPQASRGRSQMGNFGDPSARYTYDKSGIGYNVTAKNSFHGDASVKLETSAVDLVCDNGMVMVKDRVIKMKHDKEFDLGRLQSELEVDIHAYLANLDTWQRWALRELGWEEARGPIVAAGLRQELAASLLARFRHEAEVEERGQNVFALYSALTYYSTHNSEEFEVEGTKSQRGIRMALRERARKVRDVLRTPQWVEIAGTEVA